MQPFCTLKSCAFGMEHSSKDYTQHIDPTYIQKEPFILSSGTNYVHLNPIFV
jgi:hypothetical protein